MSFKIDIIANGQKIDVLPGAEDDFYLSLISYDLSDLETRASSYARELELPETPTNRRLFGEPDYITSRPAQIYRRYDVQILIEGVPLQRSLEGIFVGVENRRYRFQILGSTAAFYDRIGDNLIGALDFSEVNFDMNLVTVRDKMENSDGKLITPFLDWYDLLSTKNFGLEALGNAYFLRDYNILYSGFALYAKYIIDKTAEAVGYTTDWSNVQTPTIDELALLTPVFKFVDAPDPTTISGRQTKQFQQYVFNSIVPERVEFNTETTAPTGASWSTANDEYTFTVAATITVTLQIDYTMIRGNNSAGSSWVRVYRNNSVIIDRPWTSSDSGRETLVASNIQVQNGDTIHVEAYAASRANGQPSDELYINGIDSYLSYDEQTAADPSVIVSEWLPEITQKEFLLQVVKMFNLVIDVDPITKTVAFYDFNDIFESEPQDLSRFVDVDRDIEADIQLSKLARLSYLRWDRDTDTVTADWTTYTSENETLEPTVDLITLTGFSVSDTSYFNTTRNGDKKLKFPAFNLEPVSSNGLITVVAASQAFSFTDEAGGSATVKGGDLRAGDYLYLPGTDEVQKINTLAGNNSSGTIRDGNGWSSSATRVPYQVFRFDIENAGVMPRLASIKTADGDRYINDGVQIENVVSGALEAQFHDDIRWGTLYGLHYEKMLNILDRSVGLRVWLLLPTWVVYNLDLLRRVYLRRFDAYFYINKIEQWKVDELVRVEFVLLSRDYIAAGAEGGKEVTGHGFDAGFDDGFDN